MPLLSIFSFAAAGGCVLLALATTFLDKWLYPAPLALISFGFLAFGVRLATRRLP